MGTDGEFNRCRGCETSTGHFTPDDRGYGELNRCRDSRLV